MIPVIEIILWLNIAIPITQYDNMILDEYQYNERNNISINRNHTQQDFFLIDEKTPVHFINLISNTLQRFFAGSDLFGHNIVKYTIALFVVIDPIGTVPLFIALTENMQKGERKAVSKIAVVTAGVLLIVFAVAGTQILSIFGITIFSFLIAGGVLLFIVSIELLTYGAWRFEQDIRRDDSGVVPLAFPLLAGPGSITSVIILYQTSGIIITILSIMIVLSLTYIILFLASPIYRFLGRRGSTVITRVFAVLVAAFAVQYIVEGIRQVYFTMF